MGNTALKNVSPYRMLYQMKRLLTCVKLALPLMNVLTKMVGYPFLYKIQTKYFFS